MWLLNQILLDPSRNENKDTNERDLREFFNISESHVLNRIRVRPGGQLWELDGSEPPMIHFGITLHFRENGIPISLVNDLGNDWALESRID